MDIKEKFEQEVTYIQEQLRLIESGCYYGGPNGSPGDGSLQKISENIKKKLNEIFKQIQKGEGSQRNQQLYDLFEIMDKE